MEYSRQQQRSNPNTDFLLHEGGTNPINGANKDLLNTQTSTVRNQNANQNTGRRDYVAQFPPLKPSTTLPSSNAANNNLAPQSPSPKPSTTSAWNTQLSGGKRDYVAPQYPTPKPIQGANVTPKPSTTATLSTLSNGGKRDYVAPQYPTLKPAQGSNQPASGKVKDLVNFYDNQGGQNPPQKVPSYSSILTGSTSKTQPGSVSTTSLFIQTTQKPGSQPTKPFSYSNAVSGSKTPNTQTSITTSKPSTKLPSNIPTSRPTSPVFPNSLVNQNSQSNTNAPTDLELQALSEELLQKDVNNAARYITVNYQAKTTSQSKEDKAPIP